MKDVTTREEMDNLLLRLRQLLRYPAPFPQYNFVQQPVAARIVGYHYLFRPEFFNIIKSYARRLGEHTFAFVTLQPDPIDVYHKLFGTYPAAMFDINDVADAFNEFV